MHEVNTHRTILSENFICETSQQIYMNFGIDNLCYKLLGTFNYGLYQFSITPTLLEAQIKLYQFSHQNEVGT